MWWERFSSQSETLSSWINEKEKELEVVSTKSSLDPLDKNISAVEVGHVSPLSKAFYSVTCFSNSPSEASQVSALIPTAHFNNPVIFTNTYAS